MTKSYKHTLFGLMLLFLKSGYSEFNNSTKINFEKMDFIPMEVRSQLTGSSIMSDILDLMPLVANNISFNCVKNLEDFRMALQSRKAWAIKGEF